MDTGSSIGAVGRLTLIVGDLDAVGVDPDGALAEPGVELGPGTRETVGSALASQPVSRTRATIASDRRIDQAVVDGCWAIAVSLVAVRDGSRRP